MTLFIPEWTRVSGRDRSINRVFKALGDDAVVRRPMQVQGWSPGLFVQHPATGWLALVTCKQEYDQIAPDQLFESPEREVFERMMADFRMLDGLSVEANQALSKLVLLDACNADQVAFLAAKYSTCGNITLVSRDDFIQQGAEGISERLAPLDADTEQALLERFFAEAGIPVACTARRDFRRNNNASLTAFFLNAQQESAVKFDLDFELPAEQKRSVADFSVRLINGVAGSGKTLIAVNRALLLARMLPSQRVLILSLNTPIIADLKTRLLRAYGRLPANLDIMTYFQWTTARWQKLAGEWPSICNVWQLLHLVQQRGKEFPELGLSDDQLMGEFDFINDLLLASEADYLAADRAGQGFALRGQERSLVWVMYQDVSAILAQSGQCMWSAVSGLYLQKLRGRERALANYRHILIDEAQFFVPAGFQVIKSALAEGGQLFLCADPNQGFLKRRLSWRGAGLDVVGRTRKLRRSYRTTRSILQAADQLLQAAVATRTDEYLQPDYSHMDIGEPPGLIVLDSPQDVIDRVVSELAALIDSGRVALSSLLLVYGDGVSASQLLQALGSRVGWEKLWDFNRHKKAPPQGHQHEYLRIAALKTATGLEAVTVFLVGVDTLLVGTVGDTRAAGEPASEREERARQLFMAMTRAACNLTLLVSQRPGLELENVFVRRQ